MKQCLCISLCQKRSFKPLVKEILSGLRFLILIVLFLGSASLFGSEVTITGSVMDISQNKKVPNHEIWYFDASKNDTLTIKTNGDGNFSINLNVESGDSSFYLCTIDPCTGRNVYYGVGWWSNEEVEIKVCGQQHEPACEAFFTYATDFVSFSDEALSKVQFSDCSKGDIVRWEWDFGDGDTSVEKSPVHIYEEYGDYLVTLNIFTGNCESEIVRHISVYNVDTLSESCKANFEFYYGSDSLESVAGSAIYFYNTSFGYYDSYNWAFGDGTSATGKEVMHEYSEAGNYKVILTVSKEECEHSLTREIVVTSAQVEGKSVLTSIDDFATMDQLKMFPNPATDLMTISFDSKLDGDVVLEIYNMQGCKCLSTRKKTYLGANSIPIDVSKLKSGQYLIRIQNNKEIQTQVIIKH